MKVVIYSSEHCQEIDVDTLTLETATGEVAVKAGHEPTIWRLVPGVITGHKKQEITFEKKALGGVAFVQEQKVELSIDCRDLLNF